MIRQTSSGVPDPGANMRASLAGVRTFNDAQRKLWFISVPVRLKWICISCIVFSFL